MTVVRTVNSALGGAGRRAGDGARGEVRDGAGGGPAAAAGPAAGGGSTARGPAVGALVRGGAAAAPAVVCEPEPAGSRDRGGRYTISEVVQATGMSAHTLRWYERIGLVAPVDRSHTGQRRFSDHDLEWLAFIGKLRLTGMPVADMVRYAELVRAGEHTRAERRALLEATRLNVRRRIAELRDTLTVLDYKIAGYTDAERVPERTA